MFFVLSFSYFCRLIKMDTWILWNKTICKHIQARGKLRYYKKKNTDKAKSCLGLKLRNFTIESIQTKAKLCSKYMCQFEAYKSRMLSTSNQGSSDLTRQIAGLRLIAWIFAPPTFWDVNWWIFIKQETWAVHRLILLSTFFKRQHQGLVFTIQEQALLNMKIEAIFNFPKT